MNTYYRDTRTGEIVEILAVPPLEMMHFERVETKPSDTPPIASNAFNETLRREMARNMRKFGKPTCF